MKHIIALTLALACHLCCHAASASSPVASPVSAPVTAAPLVATPAAKPPSDPASNPSPAASTAALSFNSEYSVGDIATSITAVIALVALVFAYHQVREAKRQRHSQITQHVFDILGSKSSRELRRYIYNNIPSDPGAHINDSDWSRMEDVWIEFERVAQYVHRGLADREAVVEMYAFGIIASWKKLAPFAELQATRRGAPSSADAPSVFLQGFRQLAADAEAHWRKKYPNHPPPEVVEWLPGYRTRPNPSIKRTRLRRAAYLKR